uniref:Transcription initiation factor IIA gamma subunit C-terminal domain-containing protein n=1 Tax=Panagrolaimus sp. PS1159 TaxID=55785 RepID=A0AC35FQ31_9BILA
MFLKKCLKQFENDYFKNRYTFKANKLRAYRFCDNVWTFVMEDVEVKDPNKQATKYAHMKIVACDASRKG